VPNTVKKLSDKLDAVNANLPILNKKYNNKKVLIVDKDEKTLKILSDILIDFKTEVNSLKNGLEALEEVINKTYDVLIIGTLNDEFNTNKLLDSLKEIDTFNIPIIIIKSNNIKLTDYKPIYYIKKPITKEELDKVLEETLKR